MPDRIALIDYGAGNLRSVENALRVAGAADVRVTADPDAIRMADRIVLPGVGAYAAAMAALSADPQLIPALEHVVLHEGRPFLGICVGMQLMADAGEEFGRTHGLGWIPGTVRRLAPADRQARIPHMGWNDVAPAAGHPLVNAGEAYFLHSFAFDAPNAGDVAAVTDHGGPVTAVVARANMIGVQFHPEKSQAYGLAFLHRFLEWQP